MTGRKVTDTFYKYEKGRFGLKYDDGHILELNLTAGCSSHGHPDVKPLGLKWFEELENGEVVLRFPLWKILGYENDSDFGEDIRCNSSTGYVLDCAMKKMPERWHEYLKKKIRCW